METITDEIMKTCLNLGCGDQLIKSNDEERWINIDINKIQGVKNYDCTAPLPYKKNVIDKIYSHHFVEHMTEGTFIYVLRNWYSILKEGGELEINTPDLDGLVKEYEKDKLKFRTAVYCYPENPMMTHMSIYWFDRLKQLLEEAKFKDITVHYESQCDNPAMKVKAYK